MKIRGEQLAAAQETLLMPLWARAHETGQPDPILIDPKATALIQSIDYDFSRFARHAKRFVGFCIRAAIMDRLARKCIERHPDMTIVEIGAGLDTRFDRVDNGTIRWFDLDLPDVIAVRERFMEQTQRRTFLATSVVETDWLDCVAAERTSRILFVAEGILYFLTQPEVRDLFRRFADRFPGASILFDAQSPFGLWYNNVLHPLSESRLTWSLSRASEIEAWDPRCLVEQEIGFGDPPYYTKAFLRRLPWHQRLVRRFCPPSRHLFKICQVRLGKAH